MADDLKISFTEDLPKVLPLLRTIELDLNKALGLLDMILMKKPVSMKQLDLLRAELRESYTRVLTQIQDLEQSKSSQADS